MAAIKKRAPAEGKKPSLRFVIDCSEPVEDEVLVLRDFEKYLKERVKVDGKKGNFGSGVALAAENARVTISSSVPFSKRCLKYLTKKYLKKVKIADYLRVVATDKHTYQAVKTEIYSLAHRPLFAKLRESVAIVAIQHSVGAAAQRFDLRDDYVLETVKGFMADLERDRDLALFPYDRFDAAAQTSLNSVTASQSDAKSVQAGESSIDAAFEPPPLAKKRKKPNTRQKIDLVREFCRPGANPTELVRKYGVPLHQLLRWKERIRKVLFQDEHAKQITTVKVPLQDKFLRKADKLVHKWYVKKKQRIKDPEQAIRDKAIKVAQIDDLKPVVSAAWVTGFMKTHGIPQAPKPVEIIDCDQDYSYIEV